MTDDPQVEDVLVVEDLMLLLMDDSSGAIAGAGTLHYTLGGAVLMDLALRGAVELEKGSGLLGGDKVRAVPDAVPEDPLLRAAHEKVSVKTRAVLSAVLDVGGDLRRPVLERLAERGLVREEKRKMLGFIPTTRMPIADGRHEEALRERVRAALQDGAEVDAHTAAVIGLVSASGTLPSLHPNPRWSGEVYTRGKEFEQGHWGSAAVATAVTATAAAVAASTAIAVASATNAATNPPPP